MFKGSIVALATPMRQDGALDEAAFEALIDWQIDNGTTGIVPVGTTGESPTLTHLEHRRLIDIAVRSAAGRVPVIAGTGSNSTAEAIETTQYAQQAGADAALVVTPYYNKPTQDGLYRHYMAIADSVTLPIIIYNIPGRSVIEMSVDTMAALAKHPNIVGVKDSTANLLRPLQTRRAIGDAFCQLSGEDGTALSFNAAGGVGCISVTANVAPAVCAQMQAAWADGRVAEAMTLQQTLLPLHDALFVESNPAPVKYGLSLLGRAEAYCRLPLAPLRPTTCDAVRSAMVEVGLLG